MSFKEKEFIKLLYIKEFTNKKKQFIKENISFFTTKELIEIANTPYISNELLIYIKNYLTNLNTKNLDNIYLNLKTLNNPLPNKEINIPNDTFNNPIYIKSKSYIENNHKKIYKRIKIGK